PGFHIEAFRLAIARKIVLAPLAQSFYHWTTSELVITEHSLELRRGNVS
ncbi:heteromeric transposase endonuclease subunit TnsA, partial [Vibrio anguillarum]|nr:heteromeric transposase endonuclease subunit TnsA [Vibrio anguillarum]